MKCKLKETQKNGRTRKKRQQRKEETDKRLKDIKTKEKDRRMYGQN